MTPDFIITRVPCKNHVHDVRGTYIKGKQREGLVFGSSAEGQQFCEYFHSSKIKSRALKCTL